MKQIFQSWWPMAMSWLFMALEWPMVSAIIARLENPEFNLAALGGVAFPIAMVIEAPIIHLLVASTTLCKDKKLYRQLYRYMMVVGASLTLLHLLLSVTPLFDSVLLRIINPPPELHDEIRQSLILLLPWTWSIAYRRFHQGVLIRSGRTQMVGLGTLVRLLGGALALALCLTLNIGSGATVGAIALSFAVFSEAVFIGVMKSIVMRTGLFPEDTNQKPLTPKSFFSFYLPLAMASILYLCVHPLGSAAMSRMPNPIISLALWPIVSNFIIIFRSPGLALLEVVITYLDKPGSLPLLKKFCGRVLIVMTLAMILVSLTPIATFWFSSVVGLNPQLSTLAKMSLWMAIPMVMLTPVYGFHQALITHAGKTIHVTIAVFCFISISALVFAMGLSLKILPGLFVTILAFSSAMTASTSWLWFQARRLRLTGN